MIAVTLNLSGKHRLLAGMWDPEVWVLGTSLRPEYSGRRLAELGAR